MIFRVDILKQNIYHGHMFPREMLLNCLGDYIHLKALQNILSGIVTQYFHSK